MTNIVNRKTPDRAESRDGNSGDRGAKIRRGPSPKRVVGSELPVLRLRLSKRKARFACPAE